ncbi:hypothetical protein LC613_19535 [Nostoc sphaeroides CHAB 2801]|uniref:hypothetical protein n=1 Tax=Nostoc sphaeroides TaxID=446679 RepID=UPI0015F2F4A1|nr:hypothetical protein [Nostoc sphaeroides]MCC5630103.1 hypothetical protein [Nostoc sphaeroides CHAB 2801]
MNHHAVVIAHLLFTFLAFKVLQPFEYPLNVILQDIFITLPENNLDAYSIRISPKSLI